MIICRGPLEPSPSLQRADKTAVSLAAVSLGLSLLLIQTLPLSPGSGAVTCSMGQGFDLNTRGEKWECVRQQRREEIGGGEQGERDRGRRKEG